MALRAQHLDQLHASWDGTGFALWAIDGTEVYQTLALRSLATMAFGYGGLALLGSAVTPLYLPAGVADGDSPLYAPSLRPFEENAYSFVAKRYGVSSTSASLRWMFAAADLAVAWAANGGLAPRLRRSEFALDPSEGDPFETTSDRRWEASWRVRYSPQLEKAIATLENDAPPAIWAPFPDGPPPSATMAVVEYFADGAARWALDAHGWKPDLGRSNRADMVIARRFTRALRNAPSVIAATADQESAIQQLGRALDEHRTAIDAGVPFASRARLTAPDLATPYLATPDIDPSETYPIGDEDEAEPPWHVSFEVVLVDDPTVTLPWSELPWNELEAGTVATTTTPSGVEITDLVLRVIRHRTRELAAALAALIPEFVNLDPQQGRVALDLDGVSRLLGEAADQSAALGCPLLVPKDLAKRRLRLTAKATAAPAGGPSAGLGQAMVDVDWGVAFDGETLSDAEIVALAASKSELIQLRGAWVRVDAGHVANTLQNLSERRDRSAMTPAELLRLAATPGSGGSAEVVAHGDGLDGADDADDADDQVSAEGWLADLLAGLPDDRLTEAEEPEGFVGTLRPYQRRAVGWLGFLARLDLGGCLADDMGLGKTPTTLAHLLSHRADRPSLVMCPLSIVHNWQAEAARFAPSLKVLIAHGAGRQRGLAFARQLDEADLVISTYGTVTRDIEAMSAHEWNIVVCDEAQAIKNHRTKAARAVRSLRARQVIALTGTPVENRLTELWSILDAANPGSLGGVGWFRDTFATPIETRGDERALAGMKRLTAPFVLRRTKADKSLVPDLPDKIEQVAWAHLTEEQAGLYQAVLDDFLDEADDTSAEEGGMQRRGLVLATLTRLKQICNHPAQFLAAGGEEPGRLRGRSGKLERFDELIGELLEADERALIFTQYRAMGDLLVRHLAEAHDVRAKFLHGGVSRTGREEMVTTFQSGDSAPLQVVSLKAGGTGLNLTAASRVLHFDRWWNPAVEDQATDRAWRIGQRSTVFVHKLVCRGTLEERIDGLLKDKKTLADSAVSSGEGWLTEMSTDQLNALLSLDASAVGAEGNRES